MANEPCGDKPNSEWGLALQGAKLLTDLRRYAAGIESADDRELVQHAADVIEVLAKSTSTADADIIKRQEQEIRDLQEKLTLAIRNGANALEMIERDGLELATLRSAVEERNTRFLNAHANGDIATMMRLWREVCPTATERK